MVQSTAEPVAATRAKVASRASIREAHTQRLTEADAQAPKDIQNVQIIAAIDITSVKFDKHGSLNVTLAIPPEFTEEALLLRFMTGYPVSVDFQRWIPSVIEEDDDGSY